jgi:hypothetical protein
MFIVNRSVAIVKPRQPFVEWANSVSNDGKQYTIEDLSSECNAILLPEYQSDEHLAAIFEDLYSDVFEVELSSWVTDKAKWPRRRTAEIFREWFEVEVHSMVFDPFQYKIEKEPYVY